MTADPWIDWSPIAQLRRELDRLVPIEAAYHQAYGVAWSLGVVRCTSAEKELEEAKKRIEAARVPEASE